MPIRSKVFNLSNAMRYSITEILAELDKCDAVCANCHRERTAQRLREAEEQVPIEVGGSD